MTLLKYGGEGVIRAKRGSLEGDWGMAEIGVGAESQEVVYSILSQAGPDSVLSSFGKITPEVGRNLTGRARRRFLYINHAQFYVLTIASTSSKILAMFHFWQQWIKLGLSIEDMQEEFHVRDVLLFPVLCDDSPGNDENVCKILSRLVHVE